MTRPNDPPRVCDVTLLAVVAACDEHTGVLYGEVQQKPVVLLFTRDADPVAACTYASLPLRYKPGDLVLCSGVCAPSGTNVPPVLAAGLPHDMLQSTVHYLVSAIVPLAQAPHGRAAVLHVNKRYAIAVLGTKRVLINPVTRWLNGQRLASIMNPSGDEYDLRKIVKRSEPGAADYFIRAMPCDMSACGRGGGVGQQALLSARWFANDLLPFYANRDHMARLEAWFAGRPVIRRFAASAFARPTLPVAASSSPAPTSISLSPDVMQQTTHPATGRSQAQCRFDAADVLAKCVRHYGQSLLDQARTVLDDDEWDKLIELLPGAVAPL